MLFRSGEEMHTLLWNEMPEHYHHYPINSPGTDSGIWGPVNTLQQKGDVITPTFATGNSHPHNNMPPYYVVVPQIRAKVDVVYAKMPESIPAGDVTYDNTGSGLQAETVQGAVDEVAGRTDGLINIDDIVFSLSAPFNTLTCTAKVVNGNLIGVVKGNSSTPSAVSVSCNYNISTGAVLGTSNITRNISGTTALLYADVNYNTQISSVDDLVHVLINFSAKWDPTWTKKEAR